MLIYSPSNTQHFQCMGLLLIREHSTQYFYCIKVQLASGSVTNLVHSKHKMARMDKPATFMQKSRIQVI